MGASDIYVSPPQSGSAAAQGAVASLPLADRQPQQGQGQGQGRDAGRGAGQPPGGEISLSFLEPNNFVCTTAVKAYGRKGRSTWGTDTDTDIDTDTEHRAQSTNTDNDIRKSL